MAACGALLVQLGALGCGSPQVAPRRSADAAGAAACTTLEQCIAECHARANEDAGYRPACARVAASYERGPAADAELARRYHRLAEGLPSVALPAPAPKAEEEPCSRREGPSFRHAAIACLDPTRWQTVSKVADLTAVEVACIEERWGRSLHDPSPAPRPCGDIRIPASIFTQQ